MPVCTRARRRHLTPSTSRSDHRGALHFAHHFRPSVDASAFTTTPTSFRLVGIEKKRPLPLHHTTPAQREVASTIVLVGARAPNHPYFHRAPMLTVQLRGRANKCGTRQSASQGGMAQLTTCGRPCLPPRCRCTRSLHWWKQ